MGEVKRRKKLLHILSCRLLILAVFHLSWPYVWTMETSIDSFVDTTKVLDEVLVKASYHNSEIVPVQVLSDKDLQRVNSRNVADAIRVLSGTQIKDYGGVGGLKTVDIRSMGTNHTGVFYDGVEVGNAQNGAVDLGRFSIDNIECISLYNGQKSSVFQPAKDFASASAIYMQPRTPSFESSRKDRWIATLRGGSFATINPSLLWEHKWTESLSTSVSTEFLHTDGRYKFRYKVDGGYDTTAIRKNGDVDAFRAEMAVFGAMSRGYWRARAYYYRSERGYPGAVVKNRFSNEDRQWDTNVFVQSSFKKDFSSLYSLMVNGKVAYDYLHYVVDPFKDEAAMYVNNRYRQQDFYLSAANRFTLNDWWTVNVSVDDQFNKLHSDQKQFTYPRRNALMTALAMSIVKDWFQLQASMLASYITDINKLNDNRVSTLRWSPSVMFNCVPLRDVDLSIRAFYKRVLRMPTLNELYYTNIGKSDLKPEYATQYNVGAVYRIAPQSGIINNIEINADLYYNQVTDKIIAIPTNSFFRWSMLNLGKVRIKGADISLQATAKPIKDMVMVVRLGYTYQRAQDYTDKFDTYYRNQIPYIPRNSGSVSGSLEWRGWQLNGSFIYTGERYSSRANIAANYVLPWYTTDISISKSLNWGVGKLKTTLEVNNLFNQQYEVVINYPMPGINFRGIVQYEF